MRQTSGPFSVHVICPYSAQKNVQKLYEKTTINRALRELWRVRNPDLAVIVYLGSSGSMTLGANDRQIFCKIEKKRFVRLGTVLRMVDTAVVNASGSTFGRLPNKFNNLIKKRG